MTHHNLQVAGADFDEIKSQLKAFLKQNHSLTDVDFEGSGAAVLLDLLAYNTFHNNVYLNAASNEMFLGTAIQRSSVVAHAAPLGYTPRSFTAARATGEVVVVPRGEVTVKYLTLPAGHIFMTKIQNRNYRFQTLEASILEYDGSVYRGYTTLYEGTRYTFRYTVDLTDKDQKFLIQNTDVDVELLEVGVIRNSEYSIYNRSTTVTNTNATTKTYWLSEGDDGLYEVRFGDGVFGEDVSNNDIVVLTYYVCNGAIPNGARLFDSQTSIGGSSNITFIPKAPAFGGSVNEDIESIRNNASNVFEAQDRAVTWKDYSTLIETQFGFIETISVWGGEDNDPPFYGRVFISAKPISGDTMTTTEMEEMERFVRTKNVSSFVPMFVQPEYIYLKLHTDVKFNYERSPFTVQETRDRIKTKLVEFVDQKLEKFKTPFKYSNVVTLIDQSVVGVSSNDTKIKLIKRITPDIGARARQVVQFNCALREQSIVTNSFKCNLSDEYIYLESSTERDSSGDCPITYYYIRNNVKTLGEGKVGTINYDTGIIGLDFMIITSVAGDSDITIEVEPLSNDYTPIRNTLLTARESDITVNIIPEIVR